jgi:putative FmdB family regulatory protein
LPLYEYECTACKHRFELLQKFSDEPAKVCVRCGEPVVRLLSSPAIQFKGTGWYVTDYAGKNSVSAEHNKENGQKSSETTESDKSSAGKSSKDTSASGSDTPAKS